MIFSAKLHRITNINDVFKIQLGFFPLVSD